MGDPKTKPPPNRRLRCAFCIPNQDIKKYVRNSLGENGGSRTSIADFWVENSRRATVPESRRVRGVKAVWRRGPVAAVHLEKECVTSGRGVWESLLIRVIEQTQRRFNWYLQYIAVKVCRTLPICCKLVKIKLNRCIFVTLLLVMVSFQLNVKNKS